MSFDLQDSYAVLLENDLGKIAKKLAEVPLTHLRGWAMNMCVKAFECGLPIDTVDFLANHANIVTDRRNDESGSYSILRFPSSLLRELERKEE